MLSVTPRVTCCSLLQGNEPKPSWVVADIEEGYEDFDRYGGKNATFCAIYISNRTFYQDRLGTNIGKTQKRVAFCAGQRGMDGGK
eukprot:COSAG06_NODE_66511_length_254_cov_0.664516_1_plen_84_part_11